MLDWLSSKTQIYLNNVRNVLYNDETIDMWLKSIHWKIRMKMKQAFSLRHPFKVIYKRNIEEKSDRRANIVFEIINETTKGS